jgi:hypothetical protein
MVVIMRQNEVKTSKKYAKQLTFQAKVVSAFDGLTTAYFTDKDGTPWIHYQIDPERCENDKAVKKAKEFITKLNKLKQGDVVYCYGIIRLMDNGECYRDVDTIICKM